MINLREIRMKNNLSMDKLAEMAGISKATVSNIERGMVSPKEITIEKLCNALNIEINEMIDIHKKVSIENNRLIKNMTEVCRMHEDNRYIEEEYMEVSSYRIKIISMLEMIEDISVLKKICTLVQRIKK